MTDTTTTERAREIAEAAINVWYNNAHCPAVPLEELANLKDIVRQRIAQALVEARREELEKLLNDNVRIVVGKHGVTQTAIRERLSELAGEKGETI